MADIFRHDDVDTRPDFPWPPAGDVGAVAAFGETWRRATFDPARFFRALPRHGRTGPAVLYYLVVGMLLAGASLFWSTLARGVGNSERLAELGYEVDPLVSFLLSPLLLLLGLAMAAGITHVMLLVVRGANRTFRTTARVFAYAYSPMLFGVVPWVGTVVGAIWMLAVAIIGLAAAHDTPAWKPAVAVLLPFLALLGLMVFAVLAVMAAAGILLA